MEKITKATAIYSGGNIYLYYAELENKQWIMGDEDWLIVVDTNPLADEQTYEDSGYCEWQEEHLVKQIPEKEYQEVLNKILEAIFDGKIIEEHRNFLISDLEDRYVK